MNAAAYADERKAVPGISGTEVSQVFAPMHVALAPLGVLHNLARDRMLAQEIFTTVGRASRYREI
jgi:hypothetical protein